MAAHHQPARCTGVVDVLYAGSLVPFVQQTLGPRFAQATGCRLVGYPGGSIELASQAASGVRRADVLVSASPAADVRLRDAGPASTRWYVSIARVPLVLGYNPHSRFAAALRSRPWYAVVTSPGFLLGRTDPALDPKGALSVDALRTAARETGRRGLDQLATQTTGVFPEETLLGRLAAGQLDAGFFYADEARDAGIPTVSLSPVSLSTTFTVTILGGAPHPGAALAFVRFLLGAAGRRMLAGDGFAVLSPPHLHGSGYPAAVASMSLAS